MAVRTNARVILFIYIALSFRDHLLEDAFRQLELKRKDLKKPLRISYVGCGEQGLDMGGLQKEFFQVVAAALFSPENDKGTVTEFGAEFTRLTAI